jgi:hypothetical protein
MTRNAVASVLGALLAAAAMPSGPARAEAGDDAAVKALGKEVASKGWLVFAARPEDVEAGQVARSGARGQLDLYLARPDGSKLRNITNTPNQHELGPRFSPDGTKLLYRRVAAGQKLNHDLWGTFGRLVIAEADGARPVDRSGEGELPWASWGPRGRQVACLYKSEGVIRIHEIATKKVLQEMPRRGIFQQLYWSPDGKRLAGTAYSRGRNWNILGLDVATGKATLLSRAQNCTPDWFQNDPTRVIYSCRKENMTTRLSARVNRYGFTVLMQGTADGTARKLIYGRLFKHVYFGCTSPDDKYVVFCDGPGDGFMVGEMRLIRLADTPIIPPEPAFPELKELHPTARGGPVLDLKRPDGTALRSFEPHWTYREVVKQ